MIAENSRTPSPFTVAYFRGWLGRMSEMCTEKDDDFGNWIVGLLIRFEENGKGRELRQVARELEEYIQDSAHTFGPCGGLMVVYGVDVMLGISEKYR